MRRNAHATTRSGRHHGPAVVLVPLARCRPGTIVRWRRGVLTMRARVGALTDDGMVHVYPLAGDRICTAQRWAGTDQVEVLALERPSRNGLDQLPPEARHERRAATLDDASDRIRAYTPAWAKALLAAAEAQPHPSTALQLAVGRGLRAARVITLTD